MSDATIDCIGTPNPVCPGCGMHWYDDDGTVAQNRDDYTLRCECGCVYSITTEIHATYSSERLTQVEGIRTDGVAVRGYSDMRRVYAGIDFMPPDGFGIHVTDENGYKQVLVPEHTVRAVEDGDAS